MPDLQQSTDAELEALLASEIGDRKKAVAAEILRRRQEGAKVVRRQRFPCWSSRDHSGRSICPQAVVQQKVADRDRIFRSAACPSWVINGHWKRTSGCPPYP